MDRGLGTRSVRQFKELIATEGGSVECNDRFSSAETLQQALVNGRNGAQGDLAPTGRETTDR